MNTFTFAFIIAVALSFAVEFWLAKRQVSYVTKHRSEVPAAFVETVSLAAHQKAADYTLAKSSLADIDRLVSLVALLVMT
jgi:STE24 endopeptidase